jgi:uncharacterized protein
MISEETLKQIIERLTSKFKLEKIILFGSQSRGTADDKSDVDLLVICQLNKKRRDLWLEMDRSLKGLKLAKDIVILTNEEYEDEHDIPGTTARYAWLEGKVIYERT